MVDVISYEGVGESIEEGFSRENGDDGGFLGGGDVWVVIRIDVVGVEKVLLVCYIGKC